MANYARVAPLCRTPVGVDAFDYLVPDGRSPAPGDLVRVPLRNRVVEGVVLGLSGSSPFAAKARPLLDEPPLTRFGRDWVDLLDWLSTRTFQSHATVAKAWLRLLPKKLAPWTTRLPDRSRAGALTTLWTDRPEDSLCAAAHETRGRVLILVPLAQQAERLAARLGCATLLADDAKTVATDTWGRFLENPEGRLVTTRLGAWLGVFADRVLLLEPENDEHKQDELSPRFDARLVAAWLFQRKNVALGTFGRTPPIHVEAPAAELLVSPVLCIRHVQGRSPVPRVGLDALERVAALAEQGRPVVVFHPIRGLRVRSQCRTCGFVAACTRCGSALRQNLGGGWCDLCRQPQPVPETCPGCGGVDFSASGAGIELVRREWEKRGYPEAEWRDGSPLALDRALPPQAAVLVTEPALLGGAAEDIRRLERLCRAYRLLASRVQEAEGTLILQIHEDDTERWIAWLGAGGVRALNLAERSARTVFRYPPSVRLAKLIFARAPEAAEADAERIERALREDPAFIERRGPFPIEGRPKARPRSIVHFLFRPETSEGTLVARLSPWARLAKIDLDAVAFLR